MRGLALGRHIAVQRHLVVLIAVPVLCCMTVIAWGAITIADMEFTRAIGVSDNVFPAEITARYRLTYNYWWAGPIIAAIWAVVLVCRKKCSLATLVCYIQFAVVFVTVWGVFSVCTFYVANQSFWGWRRVVVDNEVYVDKGFRPGQEPLVPGGDDLLSGELYSGKWGQPGVQHILRRAVGTYRTKEGRDLTVPKPPSSTDHPSERPSAPANAKPEKPN
jgi:hypothetical protein